MTSWPDEVVVQASARNLVVVVGAGLSASCTSGGTSPPAWDKLLKDITAELGLGREDEILELIEKDRLLDAAELVRQQAQRESKNQDLHKQIKVAVDGKRRHNFTGSEWHDALIQLDPQVLVTTNYDKIIERATSDAYAKHDYLSDGVAGDIRRGESVLLKIHGDVDKIEKVILSRTDYTKARLHGAHAMRVLEALFLTRPALLLGYRLRDPDMQLLLENVVGGRGETAAHFMLAPADMPDYERDILEFSYGITVVPFEAADYGLGMFKELADLVENAPH